MKPRKHWAANRHADFKHGPRSFWRGPHPDRLWTFDRFVFTETGPYGDNPVFDVRDLVGWMVYPPIVGQSGPDALRQHMAGELAHHAAIVCQAIDAGTDLVEITRIATLVEQEARASASAGGEDAD
jgi:hypothetical protein